MPPAQRSGSQGAHSACWSCTIRLASSDIQVAAAWRRWKPTSPCRWLSFSTAMSSRARTLDDWAFSFPMSLEARSQGCTCSSRTTRASIPVVMVHGLWSSPLTWMEMFNDLRSFPEIRDRYQFWFYLYPTGQPFWVSAAEMRDNPGRRAARTWTRRSGTRASTRWCSLAIAWAGSSSQIADAGKRRRLLAHSQRPVPSSEFKTDEESRAAGPHRLLPSQSVGEAGDHHRHAPSRQRISPTTTPVGPAGR